jgi:pantetheine-phosphate adenylyltransferase
MRERHALYPGTFDPVTFGHLDILERALALFDRVTVAVAEGGKGGLLDVEERVALFLEAVGKRQQVEVVAFAGLLVDEVRRRRVDAVVRGIRSAADYHHEWSLAGMNRSLHPAGETVYLLARPELAFISSSLVREVARHGGDVELFVPQVVAAALRRRTKSGGS